MINTISDFCAPKINVLHWAGYVLLFLRLYMSVYVCMYVCMRQKGGKREKERLYLQYYTNCIVIDQKTLNIK